MAWPPSTSPRSITCPWTASCPTKASCLTVAFRCNYTVQNSFPRTVVPRQKEEKKWSHRWRLKLRIASITVSQHAKQRRLLKKRISFYLFRFFIPRVAEAIAERPINCLSQEKWAIITATSCLTGGAIRNVVVIVTPRTVPRKTKRIIILPFAKCYWQIFFLSSRE